MNREEAKRRAEALTGQMTVEEMASQLRFDAPAVERLGIPAYNWWNEGLHGVARAGTATVFPQAIGLGATFDEELLREVAQCIAEEARAKYNEAVRQEDRDIYKGLTLWSPNVNIFRDPRWGRGHETYGEDPCLTGRMGVAFVRGLQGDGEYLMTAACAKHFAVHSGPEDMRHYFNAEAGRKEMWETYLPAFEACVKEGRVEAVMGAYNRTNGEPCCANTYLMEEVLRGMWGFEGHYVSDCWAVRDFHENHKVTDKPAESVKLALEKGCDLNCGCTYQHIMEAYEQGILPEEHIRRSAVRLFTTRYLLGMFDETEFDDIPYEAVESKAHLETASRAARESIVLLKNDGILPLDRKNLKTIGVIGPNADSRKALIGNYHGTSSRYITLLEGIQDLVGEDVRVLYSQGCHLNKDREEDLAMPGDRLSEAVTVAKHSDVVILCLGLDETMEGEEGDAGNAYFSGDKKDLLFPKPQRELLEKVIETGVPFVLCVMAGSAMDLRRADEKAAALLQVWYPGARGGRDVAAVLFGEASPSGKLPVTIYRDMEGMPDFTDYSMKGRTYRFLEKEPLYPFGYGLTYGRGTVQSAVLLQAPDYRGLTGAEGVIEASVCNQSAVEAEEVLQVYVHVEGTENEVPNPHLAAFARVHLGPEEERKVRIKVPAEAFRTVDLSGERKYEGTKALLYVGFGQPDRRTEVLRGSGSICLEVQELS